MKMLKKISAIVLVVAMMLTMVSVTSFAAGIDFGVIEDFKVVVTNASGAEINSAKAGSTVYVKAYAGEGNYLNGGFMASFAYDIVWDDVQTSAMIAMSSWDPEDKIINLSWLSPLSEDDKNPLATIPVTIPEDVEDGEVVLVSDYGTTFTVNSEMLNADFGDITIEVTNIIKNEIVDNQGELTWELEWTKPSQEAVAIIAYYDGTTMLSAELIAIADKIDEKTGMCSFISDELKYEGATMVRCYLFDKLNGLHPITNVIEEIYL